VAQSGLGGSDSPATARFGSAWTLAHSVSVTNGHTGWRRRRIASSIDARIACCVAFVRMVGLMPSRYQSQKSRQTRS